MRTVIKTMITLRMQSNTKQKMNHSLKLKLLATQQQRNTHFNIFFKTGQLNIKFDGTLSLVREELGPLIPEETPTLETAAAAAEERFTESKIAK